ncbi:acetyl/propionyl/methylcrotonyl-CoA carboxylase subunit alpha [Eisenibacter elegans]|uniref:acetyl/propionyl/methylcrotonyl-CoA carboxylase subunit alpha n=1 Tax=Eisenibacter elegans TaxID=997 RepID=UPI00054E83A0|nr:biotin carboxylase N-terminal domain-containing protein [Eisenibacter elegans]
MPPLSLSSYFPKVLIANRGEIALRIIRTCRRYGIRTVAVYADDDRRAPFVRQADEAVALQGHSAAETYLNIPKIIAAAKRTGAMAIHPGYGFLAENAAFAQACQAAGLTWIGPSAAAITQMGSKITAKQLAAQLGVPCVPGYEGSAQDLPALQAAAQALGFPLLIKAAAGGGGKGMRVVQQAADFEAALLAVQQEARSAFGDEAVLLERYLPKVRHIEVQILGDVQGTLLHLGDRECSVQRRNQKLVEEAPAPNISPQARHTLHQAALALGRGLGYTNAGTVEFVLDEDENCYFLEVNTRLQVEHPVTEAITGLDLVALQLLVAAGEPLPFAQEDICFEGHALECRLCAEDPLQDFAPSIGQIQSIYFPTDLQGLRVDSGFGEGDGVGVHFDSMLAKIITHAPNRQQALGQMAYALERSQLIGLAHNLGLLHQICTHQRFREGTVHTRWLEQSPELLDGLRPSAAQTFEALAALCLYRCQQRRQQHPPLLPYLRSGWRNNPDSHPTESFRLDEEEYTLEYQWLDDHHRRLQLRCEKLSPDSLVIEDWQLHSHTLHYSHEGLRRYIALATLSPEIRYHLCKPPHQWVVQLVPALPEPLSQQQGGTYNAPMPGEVQQVFVQAGQTVVAGEPLLVLYSMKMQNTLYAHEAGQVTEVWVQAGQLVEAGAPLLVIGEAS